MVTNRTMATGLFQLDHNVLLDGTANHCFPLPHTVFPTQTADSRSGIALYVWCFAVVIQGLRLERRIVFFQKQVEANFLAQLYCIVLHRQKITSHFSQKT